MRRGAAVLVLALLAPACSHEPSAVHAPAEPEPLAMALRTFAAGRPEAAQPWLEAARRRHPVLEDLTLWLAARAAAATGDDVRALALVDGLVATHPDSVWVGNARFLAGAVRRRTHDLVAARAAIVTAREALPAGSPRALVATLWLAELDHALDGDAVALGLAQGLRRGGARGLVGRRARRLCARIRRADPSLLARPDAQLAEAEARLREGDARGARESAQALIGQTDAEQTDRAALWVRARAERALGLRTEAEATCMLLGTGSDALAARALATAATWRWNRDDDAGALAAFQQVVDRLPDSDQAPEAFYGIGRIHQEAGRWPEAAAAYRELAARAPASPLAGEARWRAAWVEYLAGDFGNAARGFARAARGRDRTQRPAAEYWRARALEHVEDPAGTALLGHVADRHPDTYYGRLAADHLGRPSMPAGPVRPPAAPGFPDALEGVHAARARLLVALGLPRLARREVEALHAAGDDPRLLPAYTAVGAPGAAIHVAQRLHGRRAPRRYLYPLAFWDIVTSQAAIAGVDPLLVVSLIRQESLFEPTAASGADAHGLMQLLPGTARRVARAAAIPPPDAAALEDPETNVALGTRLLRELLDRNGGSRARALAAYNAGDEATAKWERRAAGRPEDEWVELITFRETRTYVKAVLRNYEVYRRLYASSPAVTSVGSPPNAPFDMMAITSPGRAEETR